MPAKDITAAFEIYRTVGRLAAIVNKLRQFPGCLEGYVQPIETGLTLQRALVVAVDRVINDVRFWG